MTTETSARGSRFLVTGALGCIGAWTAVALLRSGASVVGFDLGHDDRRLRLIASPDELARIALVEGDVTDLGSVEWALDEHEITDVIHLAALQVPACQADPPLGARVNVVGTVNVFEAIRRRRARIDRLTYAGSVGMFSPGDVDPATGRLEATAAAHPTNHYGVYKLANEATARLYWQESGISSVSLRPMTVYGPGRDQGLTSGVTKAILAAALGRSYEIPFGGRTLLQYAGDAAFAFVAASRASLSGALAFNLPGTAVSMEDVVQAIVAAAPEAAGSISYPDRSLPFPDAISSDGISTIGPIPITSLGAGVRETLALFRRQLDAGVLRPEDYGLGVSADANPAPANTR